jgi:hypothetical protein
MGRFTLILLGVWGAYALTQTIDIDPRTLFWALLLPATYLVGMTLLGNSEEH